jgi:hypothetical protein
MITVPFGHTTLVPGGFVHVSVVAEAELAPAHAIRVVAATAARPNIFRYFTLSPFSNGGMSCL